MSVRLITYKGSVSQMYFTNPNHILVFGSNTQGKHGLGTAKLAVDRCEAEYGNPRGLQGRSYAICTKDLTKRVHPSIDPFEIKWEILKLYQFAEKNPQLLFYIPYTAGGKNLNAFSAQDLADMFSSFTHLSKIPNNIVFEFEFAKLLKI